MRIIGHRRPDAAQIFIFGDDLVFVEAQMRDEAVFIGFAIGTFGCDLKYLSKFGAGAGPPLLHLRVDERHAAYRDVAAHGAGT